MISVALNGCGRIGKTFLRIWASDKLARQAIKLVAINVGPADPQALAYLIKYDSILGTYEGEVRVQGSALFIGGQEIALFAEVDAKKLPWKQLGVDWVLDASGKYTKREKALQHIEAGAQHMLISAPAQGDDITIVMGVNQTEFDTKKHTIVSLASCTTNALVPILHMVQQQIGIQYATINTVHAYTNSQALLDVNPSMQNLRRSRAATLNIVPTTTGAMEAVFRVMPTLQGLLTGSAVRVPVPVVSLIDVAFVSPVSITTNQLVELCQNVSKGYLKGIMDVTKEPLVSSDFQQNPHSVVVDATMISAVGPLGRIYGWYDNEYGYSMRLRDFLVMVGTR